MLDLSLEMKIKSFPFSIFPLVRQKLYHPIFVQYLAIALNKTYTSHQTRSSQSSFTLHTQIYYRHMYTCLDPDKHVYVRIYIMGDAYVYVQYITGTCTRANIYF